MRPNIHLTPDVTSEHASQRSDLFIQDRIPRLSRTRVQEVVRSCAYHDHSGFADVVKERWIDIVESELRADGATAVHNELLSGNAAWAIDRQGRAPRSGRRPPGRLRVKDPFE